MTLRGDVCWADLGEPRGSKPAKRRPVLVIQADPYNASRLSSTLAAVITSNTGLAAMPGNIFIPAIASGLPRDSVVNVTALVTLDKTDLGPAVGQLPTSLMHEVDRGLRRVLGLLGDMPGAQITRFWRLTCPRCCARAGHGEWLCSPDEPEWLLPGQVPAGIADGLLQAVAKDPAACLDSFVACQWPLGYLPANGPQPETGSGRAGSADGPA